MLRISFSALKASCQSHAKLPLRLSGQRKYTTFISFHLRPYSAGWKGQAFVFEHNEDLRFGLVQDKAGVKGRDPMLVPNLKWLHKSVFFLMIWFTKYLMGSKDCKEN